MAHPYYHGFTQSTQRGTLYPGQTILVNRHNVQVERYLSQGGFAHVYVVRSAVPINNNTQHVLKRIAVADQNMLNDVQKEVEVMRKLRGHPNIVDFIDASWHTLPNGGYEVFILMEFCTGGGMIDMMNRRLRERLTEAEILQVFVDVCEGVAAMHSQNPPLLHRDLKIENILQASPTLYKICDFGSAVPVSPRHSSSIQELRDLEADLGRHTTLQYRAPEMVDVYQRRHIDQKSDIWALGVLLYKLCYYTTPFEEHGPLAILNVQYRIPPYPVYSREMNALIASMLRELGTQRPTIFELLNMVHQLRGTKSRFNYAVAPQKPISFNLHSSTPLKNGFQDVITTRPPPKHLTSNTPTIPESIIPMRRGRPASTLLNASSGPSKEENVVSKESKNPWLSIKPVNTQDKLDDAWLIPGSSYKSKPEGPAVTGFGDSFSTTFADAKVVSNKPSPSPQPVSQMNLPKSNLKSSRDAFDGLASIPRAQAPPTLGEAAQNLKTGLKVLNKPPPLRGVVSRSPLPQPAHLAQTPVSPRMSASRTGLAAYRSPSLSVEQRYPSLDDLDRNWNSSGSIPRPSTMAFGNVMQPESSGKLTSVSDPNLLTTPRLVELENVNLASTLAKELPDITTSQPPTTAPPSSQGNLPVKVNLRSTIAPLDKKDTPIGSSPAKYRPSRPALARKRLSFQSGLENRPLSIPPAPKDWLTGDDTSPTSDANMPLRKEVSTPSNSSKPLSSSNVSTENLSNQTLIKLSSSPTTLNFPLADRSARTSPNSNYTTSRPPKPEKAEDTSSDEAEGPEEIVKSPTKNRFNQRERRQSSVHDLVDLYGGGSRPQQSKISSSPQRTSGILVDVSVPSGSASDLLSPSSIIPKSRAELMSRHSRSRSSSPRETKSPSSDRSKNLSSKTSPVSSAFKERKDKRPQSMFLVGKSRPDAPALLQPPVEEIRPKRAGRRSSISDMVDLYENLVINSNHRIPPPVAQKPLALKSKASPILSRFPAISPTGTSFPSKLPDPPPAPKPIPRRSSTYDYISENKLNVAKEEPELLQAPNRRLSVSPVSPVLKSSNNVASSSVNASNSTSAISRSTPSPIPSNANQETSDGPAISSPAPERPYQGVSQLISQWQRKSEEAEESRRNLARGRPQGGRPLRGKSIGKVGHKD